MGLYFFTTLLCVVGDCFAYCLRTNTNNGENTCNSGSWLRATNSGKVLWLGDGLADGLKLPTTAETAKKVNLSSRFVLVVLSLKFYSR